MDSATQAAMEIEAPIRTAAVIELVESTLGIRIGLTEITQAARALSPRNKRTLIEILCADLGLEIAERP